MMVLPELMPYRRYCDAAAAVIAFHDRTLARGAERLRVLDDSTLNPTEARDRLAELDAQAAQVPGRRMALLEARTVTYRIYEDSKGRPPVVIRGRRNDR